MESYKIKIIVYIATSKDGYIADEDGSVDWLPQSLEETQGQDYGYHAFYDSIDALIIGRKTYEQILGFGDWPYPGKRSYIFTHKPMKSSHKDIAFVTDDVLSFIQKLEHRNIKKLWMVGGSELINAFYTQGKIDEFIVTVFPNVLEKGIPLRTLNDAVQKGEMIEMHSIDFGSGVFQNHYIRNRIG